MPRLVLADVCEGYVSSERAASDYGVVVIRSDDTWRLDEAATARVRAQAAAVTDRL